MEHVYSWSGYGWGMVTVMIVWLVILLRDKAEK